jgi:hypothetical protein
MKKIISLFLFTVLINTSSSCESDDICDSPTTPRLIINFYDSSNPTTLKSVSKLFIIGEDMKTGFLFNGVSTIQVPLDTEKDVAKYVFTLNYNDPNPNKIFTDTLEFNYTRQTIYVSRACGYKINYNFNPKNTTPQAVILNNDPKNISGSWIKLIRILNYNVSTENEAQINIYYNY